MDFHKARCMTCSRQFCCAAHRADHQAKNHTELFGSKQPELLVKMFQKKAKTILLKSQQYRYQANINNKNTEKEQLIKKTGTDYLNHKPAVKRLYSEMNRRILSTTVTVTSQTRQILVPIHRLSSYNMSRNEAESKVRNLTEVRKNSPCDDGIVQTSTPIVKNLLLPHSPSDTWGISPASSISSYHTPCDTGTGTLAEAKAITIARRIGTTVTPLRGIMAKISKYEGDSPSVNNSRSRRVTFSFGSSQVSSSNSSPLESVQEVSIHEEIKDEMHFVQVSSGLVESCAEAKELSVGITEDIQERAQDSSSSIKDYGFFSCVTNIFCTAVPSFASWRISQNNQKKRSKRSRSPDPKEAQFAVTQSPVHKRPCYPCDLRKNPIRARKPISSS